MKKAYLKTALLLIFLTASLNLAGCKTTSVYVLDQAELQKVSKGDKVEAKFDGYLFSDRAISRIMNTKVDDIKRD